MKHRAYLMAAFMVLAGLSGCSSESRNVTMHKPGVYKGEKDPLPARQQDLIDRFKLVQTDR
jgi:hypothetical protein